MSENVNHPEHYNSHPAGIECIDVIEWLSFNVGSAVKYLWRAGLKGDKIEDLRKAMWYIEREIERLDKSKPGLDLLTPEEMRKFMVKVDNRKG